MVVDYFHIRIRCTSSVSEPGAKAARPNAGGDQAVRYGSSRLRISCAQREMREIVKLAGDGSYRLNLGSFRHHKEPISYQWSSGAPEFAMGGCGMNC